jgi:oligogalacturonide lyase
MEASRRCFLFSLGAAAWAAEDSGKGRIFPSVAVRYLDPATEFPVTRLTDPQFNSLLPSVDNRIVTSRGLLYASDAAGKWEAFRLDLKSGESRQLTDAAGLDPASLAFLPNERGFYHFDSGRLVETTSGNSKTREVYRVPEGFEKIPGAAYSGDSLYAAFIEKNDIRYRLQLLHLAKGTAMTLVESTEELSDPLLRPRRTSLLYRHAGEPWIVNLDGGQSRRLPLAEGETRQAQWTADGHALMYLNRPSDPRKPANLREFAPGTNADTLIANTTQFAHFHSNSDGSVFIGASASKASPYVLLLVRAVKRELALAEHRASDAAIVTPLFAPNSQSVFFVSDRHGKPAIYWMNVERFVSATEESDVSALGRGGH